jgi:predicted exporter
VFLKKIIKIAQILVVVFFISALFSLFLAPPTFETDLLSMIQDRSSEAYEANKLLADKFSNTIQLLFEAETEQAALQGAKEITKTISGDDFKNISSFNFDDLQGVIQEISKYRRGLLSDEDRGLLLKRDFDGIYNKNLAALFSAFTPQFLSISEDPFLLFKNYILNLPRANGVWENKDGFLLRKYSQDGKYYVLTVLKFRVTPNFMDDGVYKKLQTLKDDLTKFNTDSFKVHLSGSPFHAALAAQQSKKEINFLSFLSLSFVFGIAFFFFRNFKFVLPLFLATSFAFFSAFMATSIFFSNLHILTFVFGTTLIGISVDYSLHFFIARMEGADGISALHKIFKNLLMALLTTLLAFTPLLFSGLIILRQIALFSMFGMLSAFLFVVGFYILLTKNWVGGREFSFKRYTIHNLQLPPKCRFFVAVFFSLFLVYGCSQVVTNDSIQNFYTPDKDLLAEDVLFHKLNAATDTTFLLTPADTLQGLLEREESLAERMPDLPKMRLSSFIPSLKRQRENAALIEDLFGEKSSDLQGKLKLSKELSLGGDFLDLENATLPPFLKENLNNFILRGERGYYSIIQLPHWIDLTDDLKDTLIISPQKFIVESFARYRLEVYRLLAGTFAVLMFFLLAVYGKRGLFLLLPSLLSILSILALCGVLHHPITFFHLLSFFLLMGLSLDYIIFSTTLHSAATSYAVLGSFLTSFVGFGLLAFTTFTLTKTLGLVLGGGLLFAYLSTKFLTGYLLKIRQDKTEDS